MKLDLVALMPEGKDGKRALLPKQAEFFNSIISNPNRKFVGYVGGVGSGKTKIGVLTMIAMAVMESGDYLIARQYYPELLATTYKEFLEMLPKELLHEHRVAERLVRIKAANGISNIYFRPLEDFDKLRSMNLNAFLIDEANQVAEEAFLLLQGRLRGRAWRKGMVVSNPSGRDWLFRWFMEKDHIKDEKVKNMFSLIRAPSTENIHLPEGYIDTMLATWSRERILREIEGSFDAFEGAVYEEFKSYIHIVHPFAIPTNWPKFIGIDHGYRNPSAWVYGAVGPDGEVYIYREYYQNETLIKDVCAQNLKLIGDEKIKLAVIDPSTRARRGSSGESDWDEYIRFLPNTFPLQMANNDVTLGIDRVKQYLRVDDKSKKPLLYIFNTCKNLVDEISQYRYQELRSNQEGKKNENERPVKVNDHAVDALRYLIMLLPEPYKEKINPLEDLKYNSLERSLAKELEELKKKKAPKDLFGSGF